MMMFEGAVCHVGALFPVAIVIVRPTDMAGEPLSVAVILKLQV